MTNLLECRLPFFAKVIKGSIKDLNSFALGSVVFNFYVILAGKLNSLIKLYDYQLFYRVYDPSFYAAFFYPSSAIILLVSIPKWRPIELNFSTNSVKDFLPKFCI